MSTPTPDAEQLTTVLERARTAGFLGPGPLRVHAEHSAAFAAALPHAGVDRRLRLLDLGSGGGIPGLPIFAMHPWIEGALLDTSERRCAFLSWAVVELGLAERVEVMHRRAEEAGRESAYRETFDVVTARGFAPPGETVECAAPFLREGGSLLISEPPGGRSWDAETLAELSMSPPAFIDEPGGLIARFTRLPALPTAVPRHWRQLSKRPYPVIRVG